MWGAAGSVAGNCDTVSCFSSVSPASANERTALLRVDASSPSSNTCRLASAPARLQLPAESDCESWDDPSSITNNDFSSVSSVSDYTESDLMTQSRCRQTELLVRPHVLPQHAQQAGAFEFEHAPQHAACTDIGTCTQASPLRMLYCHVPAYSLESALDTDKVRSTESNNLSMSVSESHTDILSDSSPDKLTAQRIRERYPHLFQSPPPLEPKSEAVTLAPATAAAAVAGSSLDDSSPAGVGAAAETPTAADRSRAEPFAASKPLDPEALILEAADNSRVAALPSALQALSVGQVSSSLGCQGLMPGSVPSTGVRARQGRAALQIGPVRAGLSHDALHMGMQGGDHQDSALRQLLRETNAGMTTNMVDSTATNMVDSTATNMVDSTPGALQLLSNCKVCPTWALQYMCWLQHSVKRTLGIWLLATTMLPL